MPSGVLFFCHADRETLDLSVYPWAGRTDVRRCSHGAREGTPMQELRFVAVSEDGSYAVLAVPGRSGRFILSIDERLRAVAQGQTSRLAQYEIEVESPLRPKEIQARIRAGETAEEIADAAGIPVERVRWFEGPGTPAGPGRVLATSCPSASPRPGRRPRTGSGTPASAATATGRSRSRSRPAAGCTSPSGSLIRAAGPPC